MATTGNVAAACDREMVKEEQRQDSPQALSKAYDEIENQRGAGSKE